MTSAVQTAAVRVLGGLLAALVIIAVLYGGSIREALCRGLVVGVGYALAAAAVERFGPDRFDGRSSR